MKRVFEKKLNSKVKREEKRKIKEKKILEEHNKKKIKDTSIVKNTITSLVISSFKISPKIKSKEMQKKVIDSFPASRFNIYHYSWFKNQIKQGRYNKLFNDKQLKAIFSKESKETKETKETVKV